MSRPSRSQQLRNPTLVPKLTEATIDPVEAKYDSPTSLILTMLRILIEEELLIRNLPRGKPTEKGRGSVRNAMMKSYALILNVKDPHLQIQYRQSPPRSPHNLIDRGGLDHLPLL